MSDKTENIAIKYMVEMKEYIIEGTIDNSSYYQHFFSPAPNCITIDVVRTMLKSGFIDECLKNFNGSDDKNYVKDDKYINNMIQNVIPNLFDDQTYNFVTQNIDDNLSKSISVDKQSHVTELSKLIENMNTIQSAVKAGDGKYNQPVTNLFCIMILSYVFTTHELSYFFLRETQTGGELKHEDTEVISGNKRSLRIIFKIKYSVVSDEQSNLDKTVVLKLSNPSKETYLKEIKIYKELNELTEDLNHPHHNEILKILSKNETVKYDDNHIYTIELDDGNLKITNANISKMIKIWQTNNQTISAYILVTEYTEYKRLYDYKRESKIFQPIEANVMFNKIIKLLYYLNDTIGFCHFDLHGDNILVDSEGNIKLYDFDLSSTTKNINSKYCSMIVNCGELKYASDIKEEDYKKKIINNGFKFDLTQIYYWIVICCDDVSFNDEKFSNLNKVIGDIKTDEEGDLYEKILKHCKNIDLETLKNNFHLENGTEQKEKVEHKYHKYKMKYWNLKKK